MFIAIDASRSIDSLQKTGVEVVSDEILKTINSQLTTNNAKIIYYTPEKISWLPAEKQKILEWPFKFLWTQIRLSLAIIKDQPNALFIPAHTIPWFHPQKTFVIIHDVAFIKQPEIYSKKHIAENSPFALLFKIGTFIKTLGEYSTTEFDYLKYSTEQAVKKSYKIFVPTAQVKQDLIQHFKANPEKIIVAPHGYTTKNRQSSVVSRQPQILYIGRIEEKKNILNLAGAFQIFNQKHPEYTLVLAGKPGHNFENLKLKIKNLKFLGYVTNEQKYKLLNESSCLTLISRDEGFGIPLLEGFDFNLPVLASNIPVLKEVGGSSACLYTDPYNPAQIADDLEKIIFDDKLRQELIKNGRDRLKEFDWQKTTHKILKIILNYEL